jgi:fructokinase
VIDHGQEYCFKARPIIPVSTIGAGDNFNAGMIYGFVKEGVDPSNLDNLTRDKWEKLVGFGIEFGTEACMSTENYVSREFAQRLKQEL